MSVAGITTSVVSEVGQPDYRVFFEKDGKRISPWHDIPVEVDAEKGIFNCVLEIPKGTNAKVEIGVAEELNPIKQDIKNGKLRYVADVNGAKGYPWNYGAFPQTWEDPSFTNPDTNAKGDRDPLDVVEISSRVAATGDIRQVKVLGCLALIDEGETDWKVIAIDVTDPEAESLNDIVDLEKSRPGYIASIHDWFRDYKIPDGKPANKFAFDGQPKDKAYTLKVVEENRKLWAAKYAK